MEYSDRKQNPQYLINVEKYKAMNDYKKSKVKKERRLGYVLHNTINDYRKMHSDFNYKMKRLQSNFYNEMHQLNLFNNYCKSKNINNRVDFLHSCIIKTSEKKITTIELYYFNKQPLQKIITYIEYQFEYYNYKTQTEYFYKPETEYFYKTETENFDSSNSQDIADMFLNYYDVFINYKDIDDCKKLSNNKIFYHFKWKL